MSRNPVNRRLAARFHQAQMDLADWGDALAAKIGAIYARALAACVEASGSESPTTRRSKVHSAVEQAHAAAYEYLQDQYTRRIRAAHGNAVETLLATVPAKWWRKVAPVKPIQEAFDPDQPRDEHGMWAADGGGSVKMVGAAHKPKLAPATAGERQTAVDAHLRHSAAFSHIQSVVKADGKRANPRVSMATRLDDGTAVYVDRGNRVFAAKGDETAREVTGEALHALRDRIGKEWDKARAEIHQGRQRFDQPAEDFAREAAGLGLNVELHHPHDSSSRYVYANLPAGGQFKVRFADHAQPLGWIGGKRGEVGGFDQDAGKRHTGADVSIDPYSGHGHETAMQALRGAVASGAPGRLHEAADDEDSPIAAYDELEPVRSGILTREQANQYIRQTVFPPLDREAVARIIQSPGANGVTWPERMQMLTRQSNPERIADLLEQGITAGENVRQLRDRLRPEFNNYAVPAQRIARTEGRRIALEAQQQTFRGMGDMLAGMQIVAVMDQFTRPEHAARNGRIYERQEDGSFVDKSGEELPTLPDEPNCVLPGQLVSGRFIGAGLKAWYSGPAIEIETLGGRRLSVTANHPVLTSEGFVAANRIKESDNLVCHVREDQVPAAVQDDKQAPAFIEDVFRAFRVKFGFTVEGVSALNLHGDAAFTNRKIEIVRPYLKLLGDFDSKPAQGGTNRVFLGRHMQQPGLSGCRTGQLHRHRINLPASSLVSRSHLLAAFAGGHLGPLRRFCGRLRPGLYATTAEASVNHVATHLELAGQCVRRGSGKELRNDFLVGKHQAGIAANRDPVKDEVRAQGAFLHSDLAGKYGQRLPSAVPFGELPDVADGLRLGRPYCIGPAAKIDASLPEIATERADVCVQFLRQLAERFASQITLDRVVHVSVFHYEGVVYDLQADTGFYFAGQNESSIGISNCRCVAVCVLREPEEFAADPAVRNDFYNAGGAEIPDPSAYTEWFAGASERGRMEAVGTNRYTLVAEKLAAYGLTPAWNDFLEPETGRLLPLKTLKTETPAKHAKRREAVDKMLLERQMQFIKVAGHGFLPSQQPPILNPSQRRARPAGKRQLRQTERK